MTCEIPRPLATPEGHPMTQPAPDWRTSTRSMSNGECVEVAITTREAADA